MIKRIYDMLFDLVVMCLFTDYILQSRFKCEVELPILAENYLQSGLTPLCSSTIDNLISIGSDCGKPFKFHSINHMGTVFLPIGVTIVYNGNHSSL